MVAGSAVKPTDVECLSAAFAGGLGQLQRQAQALQEEGAELEGLNLELRGRRCASQRSASEAARVRTHVGLSLIHI